MEANRMAYYTSPFRQSAGRNDSKPTPEAFRRVQSFHRFLSFTPRGQFLYERHTAAMLKAGNPLA
jgi:hypothetical protein